MSTSQTVETLLKQYGHLHGEELLRPLLCEIFVDKIALVSSFGAEAAVLLGMVSRINPNIPVIFLDTYKLFSETLAYRDHIIENLKLTNVRTIYPQYENTVRYDPDGDLWERDPNACCYIRKVEPLKRALKGFDAWITGRKRYHGGIRTDMPLIEAFEGRVKINPLAPWSPEDIASEYKRYDLPKHPLVVEGFSSIGCMPCTDVPDDGHDTRSGRWKNQNKQECGIHLGDDGKFYPIG